ncbi:MAG: hypothetical protein NTU54_05405 [Candidatus Omnitrophica bacterium]|nr:hypothetical protein [Candidatus Omnitrophota bacterium]
MRCRLRQMVVFFFLAALVFIGNAYAKDITILYTGDTHAALYPCHCPIEPDGGLARRAALIKRLKKDNPDTLLLDAGGFFAGGVMDEYSLNSELDKERTEVVLRAMDLMGYDAVSVTGEEFNFGRAFLEAVAQKRNFPFLTCNVSASAFKPYIVKEVSGLKVGIIAITEPQAQAKAEGLKFTELKAALSGQVAQLRKRGVNLIILLSRLGETADADLIKSVPGIDVLICGYSRKDESALKLGPAITVAGIWQGRKLGKLTLKIAKQHIQDYKLENIRLSDQVANDPDVAGVVPACFSDGDCSKKGFVAVCRNPATMRAACVFTQPANVNLRVITTKSSRFVDTESVVNYLKNKVPGLVVSYLDYKDKEARGLIKRFRIQAIPAYIVDKKIDQEKAFEGIKQYLVLEDDVYLMRPQFTGVTFFLSRNRIPGRIDLFFSMHDKDAALLLDAIKDSKPQVHFLATETNKGFDAKNGRMEAEEDLRACCVKEYYPQIFWDYISCRSQNADSSWWEDCLGNYNSEKIRGCARSEEGKRLLRQNIALGRELEVMFGPTYLLDNQEIFSTKGTPSKAELKKILKK